MNGEEGEWFQVKVGLQQGNLMSPCADKSFYDRVGEGGECKGLKERRMYVISWGLGADKEGESVVVYC